MKKKETSNAGIHYTKIHFNVFCALLLLIIYGQSVFFGYALDDHLINLHIPGREEGLKGILHIFAERFSQVDYRPVVILSYSVEKWIFGENSPFVSHAVNLLLYYLILILLYKTVTGFLANQKDNMLVLLALLIFAVHPVHTEVVASLKCRDNLLSLLFTILAAGNFISYQLKEKKVYFLILGSLFFVLAFLSKLDAAGLILFLPILSLIHGNKKMLTAIFYFMLLFLVFEVIRFGLADKYVPANTEALKIGVTFSENPLTAHFSFTDRIAAAALTFWYYIKMLLIPFGYRYYYGFDHIKLYPIGQWQSIAALLSGIVLLAFVIKYARKDKIMLAGIIGYLVFILYGLNFITPVAGIIADRYVFISSLFFCFCFTYLLSRFIGEQKKYHRMTIAIIVVLSILSFYRTTAWKNKLTLIERDAPHLKDSYEAMRIAASTYIEFSDKENNPAVKKEWLVKAIEYAQAGNTVYPSNVLLHKLEATAYFKEEQFAKAKEQFHIAVTNDSNEFESYNFMGDLFYLEKNLDSAYYYYSKAFVRNGNDPLLITTISTVLYEKGDKSGCIDFNQKLLAQNDSLYAAWENLGYYYLAEKDTLRSVPYFEHGFKNGLRNPEIAQLMITFLKRNKEEQHAKVFLNYTQ